MANQPPPARRFADIVEVKPPEAPSPAATWRRLCEGYPDPWLDEIGALPVEGDGLDLSLDIWAVTLIAALKEPARKQTASAVLARLRKLSDEIEG